MKLINTALFFFLIGICTIEGKAVQPEPVTVTVQQNGHYPIEVEFHSYVIWARNHNDPHIVVRERMDPVPGSRSFLVLPYDIDPKSRVKIYYSPTFANPKTIVDTLITRDTKTLQIVCIGSDREDKDPPQCQVKK